MKELNQKAPKISKKESVLLVGFFLFVIFGFMEFKIQQYSPFNQILSSVYIPIALILTGLLWLFFKRKITDPTVSNFKVWFSFLLISAILTFPFLGFVSLTNRTLGKQESYKFQGNIIKSDSSQVYQNGSSDPIYSVELLEKRTNTKFSFNISPEEYRKLKNCKTLEKDLVKGFWGFIYKY